MKASFVVWTLILAASCALADDYVNPVVPDRQQPGTPDPGVFWDATSGLYYAFTTSNDLPDHFPIRTSADLVNWKQVGFVFPIGQAPTWAATDFWAPELHNVSGQPTLFFVARDQSGILSIGVARPIGDLSGPYKDIIGQPLMRNSSGIGSIDPTYFFNSSSQQHFLVWKFDGNSAGLPTVIYAQELSADATQFVAGSQPVELIRNDPTGWEGINVEGPWVTLRPDAVYLFYSGNMFNSVGPNGTCFYAVGVARSFSGVLGPFQKLPVPVLQSQGLPSCDPSVLPPYTGPGHCSVVYGPLSDTMYMVYHAWQLGVIGWTEARYMMTDVVQWDDNTGWPLVYRGYPSNTAQPVP
eukprot:TRINITY_DN4903_c0_g1_i1.p1 TRINITY_DN4903_c0_g1~~TRINITY_DN4903_c0_g1_i1.p1  ORF type:complete len:353 (+),score=27.70 TRINITY_DN4903_c0_g1_i1:68-1126(+)